MRFQVPQFINIPDKLFGPFTFKQALYLVGGGGMVFALYKLLPLYAAVFLGVPIAGLAVALVFYRPNGRPFVEMLESFLLYSFSHKFYLWRQAENKIEQLGVKQVHEKFPEEGDLPKEDGRQKISDLAWSLDILDFEK